MEIQVGDLVTCKYKDGTVVKEVAKNEDDVSRLKQKPVIKIERPVYYEVIEEKKELLTEEEKEFLKNICKYYDIKNIYFNKSDIGFYNKNNFAVNASNYPENMHFNRVERYKFYTLKELELEKD